jgi:ElaB/YqjD/DUF883 family membrane-anchored ribosome-binding protein
MEKTAEQVYTDLLSQLASPRSTEPAVLADAFREVERLHSVGQITGWQLENAREAYARTTSAGSRIGDAAKRAVGKAKGSVQAAAGAARDRAATAVGTYTKEEPVRAILIAAGVGALLMSLVTILARSGVRNVRRRIRR